MNILSKLFGKKSKKAFLILDSQGINYIGGRPSEMFVVPKLDSSPVIYLGFVSKNESYLPIINFDLHLVCPIFIDLKNPIFLDYSDPNRPEIIYGNVSTEFGEIFDEINSSSIIEYDKLNFAVRESMPNTVQIGVHKIQMTEGEIGTSGQPIWIQNDMTPNCPISGKKMEFLFQLGDIDSCKVKIGKQTLTKEFIDPYLHFGHGFLYVFYEPTSRVVAYLNQL